MKFSIKDSFSNGGLRIWSHLLKKILMENLIFLQWTWKANKNILWNFSFPAFVNWSFHLLKFSFCFIKGVCPSLLQKCFRLSKIFFSIVKEVFPFSSYLDFMLGMWIVPIMAKFHLFFLKRKIWKLVPLDIRNSDTLYRQVYYIICGPQNYQKALLNWLCQENFNRFYFNKLLYWIKFFLWLSLIIYLKF